MNIRYPNIRPGNEREQVEQIRRYLFQLVEQLNMAESDKLQTAIRPGNASPGAVTVAEQLMQAYSPKATFNQIKSLIIKSADIVDAYYEEVSKRLEGLYVAQSEYGTFVEQTNATITANSTGISQNYHDLQVVTENVGLVEKDLASTKDALTGLIDETDEALRDTISDTQTNLLNTIDQTENSLQCAISDTERSLQGVIDQTKTDLQEAIDTQDQELRELISQTKTDLDKVVEDTEAKLSGTITNTETALQKTIDQAKQDMRTDIDNAEQRMNNSIASVEQGLSDDIGIVRNDLSGSISETEQTLSSSISEVEANLYGTISDVAGTLDTNISNVEASLGSSIDGTKRDLEKNIDDAASKLAGSIDDAKKELKDSISETGGKLQDQIDGVAEKWNEVNANIRTGLLFYMDAEGQKLAPQIPEGTPVFGVEVGQTVKENSVETFNRFARFTAYGMIFYDENGEEAAYITNRELQIKKTRILTSLTRGGFVETISSDGSSVERWVGV